MLEKLYKIVRFVVPFVIIFLILFTVVTPGFVHSEPNCDSPGPGDIDFCLEKVQKEIDALTPAHEYNKQELADLRTQINSLNKKISGLTNQLKVVEEEIASNHYKFIRLYDPLMPFISSSDASEAFREINFRQKAADEDRKTMEKYAADLLSLKKDKESLEKNKASLASAKKTVDQRATFLAGEVEKTETYLTTLTSKQNELLALKAGGFQTSVGDTPATAEPCSGGPGSSNFCDPGFRPAFAAFSFGAPHRTGMSQYGAYGRSKSGQNAE